MCSTIEPCWFNGWPNKNEKKKKKPKNVDGVIYSLDKRAVETEIVPKLCALKYYVYSF